MIPDSMWDDSLDTESRDAAQQIADQTRYNYALVKNITELRIHIVSPIYKVFRQIPER